MRVRKLKSDSCCVGGRHRSCRKNFYGYITPKRSKVLIGYCSACDRIKSMTVSDFTTQAERLGSFFNYLGRISAKAAKK